MVTFISASSPLYYIFIKMIYINLVQLCVYKMYVCIHLLTRKIILRLVIPNIAADIVSKQL